MFRKVVVLVLLCFLVLGFSVRNSMSAAKDLVRYVEPPLDFEDLDTKTAIISIFTKVGGQYIFDGAVSGTVSLHLTEKMLLDDVLNTILVPKSIKWSKDDKGMYHIGEVGTTVSPETTPREAKALITKIYPLTFANCLDMIKYIKPVLSADGQVSSEPSTNSVIVSDTILSNFDNVEKVIKQIDKEDILGTRLIVVKTKLIETTKNDGTLIQVDARAKSHAEAGREQLDKAAGGTNFPDPGDSTKTGTVGTWAKEGAGITNNLPSATGINFIWALGIHDAYVAFRAMASTQKFDILAEPEIMVLDGETAKIQIGQREPILQTTRDASGRETVSATYEDISFSLSVTPKTNKNGTISISVSPELKDMVGRYSGFPIISNRSAQTRCYIRNGGTLKIGGMLKDKQTVSEIKVPILGDIPILGLLFKQYEPKSEKTEITIFVSAYIYDFSPPKCEKTPWVSDLSATLETGTDVRIDWSKDVPKGAHNFSIMKYRVYRSEEPITNIQDLRSVSSDNPLDTSFIPGDATFWVDTTRKSRNRTYYYVVTAVNASGLQQSISTDPRYNAVITIPEER